MIFALFSYPPAPLPPGPPGTSGGAGGDGPRYGPVALLVTLLAALCGPPAASAQTAVGAGRILVMPFDSADRDPRLLWLGEASAVLIADDLRGYGFPALSRDERVRAFQDLHLPPDASL